MNVTLQNGKNISQPLMRPLKIKTTHVSHIQVQKQRLKQQRIVFLNIIMAIKIAINDHIAVGSV